MTDMQFIDIAEPGGPEQLQLRTAPQPEPAAGEVLIQVHAAGVNRADIVQRKGFYPPPPGASPIPGLEVSGKVVALGEGVNSWQVGDAVCALLAGGGYAQYTTAAAAECLPIPDGMTWADAAALPEVLLTVWSNLFMRCGLKSGERLLIHGGSSGIGSAAIQLARCFDVDVLTTVGNEEKAAFCRELGAGTVINYREEDWVARVAEATGGKGVDVILDMVGGDYVQSNIKSLAREGRLVNIAYMQGSRVEVDLMPVMLKRLTITGSTLRAREASFKADLTARVREQVWPLVAAGQVRPLVHSTFPLADAAEAHRLMESSAHMGKIILLPEQD